MPDISIIGLNWAFGGYMGHGVWFLDQGWEHQMSPYSNKILDTKRPSEQGQ